MNPALASHSRALRYASDLMLAAVLMLSAQLPRPIAGVLPRRPRHVIGVNFLRLDEPFLQGCRLGESNGANRVINSTRNEMRTNKLFYTSAVIACVLFIQEINAEQAQQNITEINAKLESIISKKIHLRDDPDAFSAMRKDPDFAFIENRCKTDWNGIIDAFEAIEGGEEAEKLVVSALQELDAGDYMSAIEKLVARFETGTASKLIIREILSPLGRMQAFLADNHAHPRVIATLNKIKAKADGDTELISHLDDILIGEVKTGIDQIREDFAGTGFGNIPQILLAE